MLHGYGRLTSAYLAALAALTASHAFAPVPAFANVIPPAHSTSSLQFKQLNKIRVRIAEALAHVQVRGFDLRISESARAATTAKLARAMDRESDWDFRCQDGRIRGTRTSGNKAETLDLLEPVAIQTPAGFLSFKGRPYRDELYIYSSGSFCEVINAVDLEKYLDGLVNAEFNSKWNEEAIAAQVVAARTYAFYQMRANRESHFDVDASVNDQVYDGSIREDFRASRAVTKSRGLVLTVGPQSAPVPLKAFYHASCGGMTELPQYVWGSSFPGFRRPVRCLFCARAPHFSWTVEFSSAGIARNFLLGARNDGAVPGWPRNWQTILTSGNLISLRVLQYDPQGRVLALSSLWSLGGRSAELRVSGSRFRDWIGAAKLKSAAFGVTSGSKGLWSFSGRGYGHGVGLCQWGAKAMGEKGYTMAAILKHYYPDAVLRRLW